MVIIDRRTVIKKNVQKNYFSNSFSFKIKIFGIFLLFIGILLLWLPLGLSDRFTLSFILTGFFLFVAVTDKTIKIQFDRIIIFSIILLVWIILLVTDFLAIQDGLDLFFFLLVIVFFVLLEMTTKYVTSVLKKRLYFFGGIIFIVYIFILVEKLLSYINI